MGLLLSLSVGRAHGVELTCGVKSGVGMVLPLSLGVGRAHGVA
jgi:hypothetical protein